MRTCRPRTRRAQERRDRVDDGTGLGIDRLVGLAAACAVGGVACVTVRVALRPVQLPAPDAAGDGVTAPGRASGPVDDRCCPGGVGHRQPARSNRRGTPTAARHDDRRSRRPPRPPAGCRTRVARATIAADPDAPLEVPAGGTAALEWTAYMDGDGEHACQGATLTSEVLLDGEPAGTVTLVAGTLDAAAGPDRRPDDRHPRCGALERLDRRRPGLGRRAGGRRHGRLAAGVRQLGRPAGPGAGLHRHRPDRRHVVRLPGHPAHRPLAHDEPAQRACSHAGPARAPDDRRPDCRARLRRPVTAATARLLEQRVVPVVRPGVRPRPGRPSAVDDHEVDERDRRPARTAPAAGRTLRKASSASTPEHEADDRAERGEDETQVERAASHVRRVPASTWSTLTSAGRQRPHVHHPVEAARRRAAAGRG